MGYLLEEGLYPINPLTGDPKKPTDEDLELLKQWASVRDSVWGSVERSIRNSMGANSDKTWAATRRLVRGSVWDSVWDSVMRSVRRNSVWNNIRSSIRDSVWDSVWAYMGSLFPNIDKWKYIDHKPSEYPFKCGSDLWRRGFVSSFDGKTWRLHSGANAEVIWKGEL